MNYFPLFSLYERCCAPDWNGSQAKLNGRVVPFSSFFSAASHTSGLRAGRRRYTHVIVVFQKDLQLVVLAERRV